MLPTIDTKERCLCISGQLCDYKLFNFLFIIGTIYNPVYLKSITIHFLALRNNTVTLHTSLSVLYYPLSMRYINEIINHLLEMHHLIWRVYTSLCTSAVLRKEISDWTDIFKICIPRWHTVTQWLIFSRCCFYHP